MIAIQIDGVAMKALVEGGEVIEALHERILGTGSGNRHHKSRKPSNRFMLPVLF